MDRYLCVHGHFYQPPRENPWLEEIELQDSAYPYHDWNERITGEAYRPNANSRILDGEGRIVKIINNYSRISFNAGPTLLKWMQDAAPDVYHAIIAADRQSMQRYSGHGSAIAQAYGHMIMPLANSRDKYTQAVWGVRDFEYRFGRRPEGMWLPETAVDLGSLDVLARLGIKFTILSPHQASRVRRLGRGGPWKDISGGRIDPTRAYLARLPSGRRISLFFYDGPISRAVAFEGLLSSGEAFANRLLSGFDERRDWAQLANIATDGESYGHHHRFGDMALAYALERIESQGQAILTNYGEYLEKHPPGHEVEVFENTAWSCPHGVERWKSDCGCNTGGRPGWNQEWRRPLREALDRLRDTVAPLYEERAGELLRDPWAARDDYISVVLNRRGNEDRFFERNAVRPLSEAGRVRALRLLELQRHAMLMYSSCGWFFDEISGIETTQVLQYAGRVIQLGGELFGRDVETGFLDLLAEAKSNIPEHKDGRAIYEKFVRPAMVDLVKVGAHFAVSSLFHEYGERQGVYCYTANVADYRMREAGAARLAIGRVRMTSEITRESDLLTFGVLHFGDHNITAGVRAFISDEAYQATVEAIETTFSRADLPQVVRLLDQNFGEAVYSLKSLFRDEQRRVLDRVLESTLAEAEATYRQLHEHHAPLMRFLLDVGYPLPRPLLAAAELVLNANIRRQLSEEHVDPDAVRALLDDAAFWGVELDSAGLAYVFKQNLDRCARRFRDNGEDAAVLERFTEVVGLAASLPFGVDLSEAQNYYYQVLRSRHPEFRERANQGDEEARRWISHFLPLAGLLRVRVE
jgi:alpha-amylase/alpha-mannosidase (GH57 family)